MTQNPFQDIVSLAKRRGFLFQSSEIYGGLSSCWDYGPLGVELKNNLKQAWWKAMVYRSDVVGLDCSIFMHPTVWKASGHVEGFHDPLVDCKKCKNRFRADHLDTSNPCPSCGAVGEFTPPRDFNLMFKTKMGPVEDSSAEVYLRPETAQGIFVNFSNVQQSLRRKVPFGIAQVGKAFRNEITPANFIFRMREFEQMEMQFFVKPGAQKEWMEKWKEIRYDWHLKMGLQENRLRFHEHGPDELAHYAEAAVDIEFLFPNGWGEMEGIHSRTDFDLKRHQEFSGKSLVYTDQVTQEKYIPYVIETSVGLDRCLLAILSNARDIETLESGETREVLRLNPILAPYKVAVLPLMKKDGLAEMALNIFQELSAHFLVEYDEAGTIGKRYRRHDEIGTPFCLTVDYDSLKENTVTIRHRDSMRQERVDMSQLLSFFQQSQCR